MANNSSSPRRVIEQFLTNPKMFTLSSKFCSLIHYYDQWSYQILILDTSLKKIYFYSTPLNLIFANAHLIWVSVRISLFLTHYTTYKVNFIWARKWIKIQNTGNFNVSGTFQDWMLTLKTPSFLSLMRRNRLFCIKYYSKFRWI